jgi:EAL domain-containing protein (putative c-di-GMP-specific phosphodiesterase class I)
VFPQHLDWDAPRWLAEADLLGLGPALETVALRAALRALPSLPTDSLLAVTISAATLLHPEVVELLTGPYALRLVVELSGYAEIEDLDDLADPLAELRAAGVLLALVEEGAGWAVLEHIERLQPEVLILPGHLVNELAFHPARQAVVEVLVGLARRIGAEVVAEGVATDDDLDALTGLGVSHAQGPIVGRPVLEAG